MHIAYMHVYMQACIDMWKWLHELFFIVYFCDVLKHLRCSFCSHPSLPWFLEDPWRSRESRFHSCKVIQSFREDHPPLLSPATQHNWRWRGFSLLSLGSSCCMIIYISSPSKLIIEDHRHRAPCHLYHAPHTALSSTPHTVLPLMTEGQPCHRVANGNLPLSWEPEQCKISGGNNADWVSPLGSIRVIRFCTHRIQSPNFTLKVNHKSRWTHIEWQRVNCVAKVAIEVLWVKTFFSGFSPDWGAIGLQPIWHVRPSIVYSLFIHQRSLTLTDDRKKTAFRPHGERWC